MIGVVRDYATAVSNWRRLVWLAMRQMLNQYASGSRLAFLMALTEPLAAITILYVVRGLLKQSQANYGTSLFLFYASGFLPFYLFIRVSTRTRAASPGRNRLVPGLGALDVYIAAVALNALIWITMIILIFLGMWLYGIDQARPNSIVTCTIPILLLIVLGAGVGMINNVINRFLSFWNRLYAILTRGLIFLSGVIFITDLTPMFVRPLIILNPLSHAVEWFRLGVYGRYPHNSLSPSYLVEWALIALFVGLIVDRAALRTINQR